jgi:prepilin-type N-terminal cleavage/methylation domain-containing protein/prepilin-type processing-associated H-X9-DG protein
MNKRKGFTLTEMMIVIGVILILAGMLVLGIGTATEQANKVQCAHNLRQIGIAANAAAIDSGGSRKELPGGQGQAAAASLNLADTRVLLCPATNEADYGFDFDHTMFDPHDTAIAADDGGTVGDGGADENNNSANHSEDRLGQNVLYIDGHVKWHTGRDVGHLGDNIYRDDEVTYDSYITE